MKEQKGILTVGNHGFLKRWTSILPLLLFTTMSCNNGSQEKTALLKSFEQEIKVNFQEGRTGFRGTPRTFNSFEEMALENAYSRTPLEVHFQSDLDAEIALNFDVDLQVTHLPWQ